MHIKLENTLKKNTLQAFKDKHINESMKKWQSSQGPFKSSTSPVQLAPNFLTLVVDTNGWR